MKIVNEKVTMHEVTAQVERTIKVGMYLNMSSSESYMGIDQGKVTVTHLGYLEDLYSDDEVPSDVADIISAHIEGEVDSMDGNENVIREEYDRLHNSIWVVYRYMNGHNLDTSALPLDMFLEHTSRRY